MCFGWRIAEYTSTGQIYSDGNPHNCHRYKDKLFALYFDMWSPILNSVFTKAVIAKHSTCKENHFGKLNGGPKHLKFVVFGNSLVGTAKAATLLFQCHYLCPGTAVIIFKATCVYYNKTHEGWEKKLMLWYIAIFVCDFFLLVFFEAIIDLFESLFQTVNIHNTKGK